MTAIRNAAPDDVARSDTDPAEGRWSQLETLAGALVNELRIFRWTYVAAHSEKHKTPPQPEMVRLPGADRAKRRQQRFSDAQYEFLYRHINGLPQEPDVHLTVIKGGGGMRGD